MPTTIDLATFRERSIIAAELRREPDPLDDPGYQEFLVETAKHCKSKHAPCGGCLAGGMCDNFDGIEEIEERELEIESDRDDEEDDPC